MNNDIDNVVDIKVGTEIPPIKLEPITRQLLALYAGASGDHNPIHIDSDFAKEAGMDDVFAQGMLSMAYLGRMLTDWLPQSKLCKFATRFLSITHLGDEIICSGKVVEIYSTNGNDYVRCEITAMTESKDKKLVGEALFKI